MYLSIVNMFMIDEKNQNLAGEYWKGGRSDRNGWILYMWERDFCGWLKKNYILFSLGAFGPTGQYQKNNKHKNGISRSNLSYVG